MNGRRPTTLAPVAAAAAAGLALTACRPREPEIPPLVKRADGKEYHVVEKSGYAGYYDRHGKLQVLEQDRNGDKRADVVAYHDGRKKPRLIEMDEDFDGLIDRWEDYDAEGELVKVGTSRRGKGPDLWAYPGPGGEPRRKEYDDDGDGKPERAEVLEAGRVARVEIDADRDGRWDRWQDWRAGVLVSEELDTDADGRADRRLRYDRRGAVTGIEPIAPSRSPAPAAQPAGR
jgi:hypothetical protein